MDWLHSFFGPEGILATPRLLALLRAMFILGAGLIVAKVAGGAVARLVARRMAAQHSALARRLVYYGVASLAAISALSQLGVNLSVFLGAAGILTVAVGFASQTSASNLISGLFLMAEQPFTIGDYIRFGDVSGEVLSIDLLSVKLRLFDNSLVRIPNENLIKEPLTNLTHFPIRRVDLALGVAYKEDMKTVRDILFAVADANPKCLDEPRPQFFFDGFGDSALELRFCVWTSKDNFIALKNAILLEIKAALDAAGIEIPFPHRSLYAGSATEPFPVRLVDSTPLPNGEGGESGPSER